MKFYARFIVLSKFVGGQIHAENSANDYTQPNKLGEKMLLVIKDLYLKRGDRMILKGLNLEIEKNEIHAVVGPNGAGKSTFLNMLAGSDYPTNGKIISDK